jgi:hypothetical protein
MVLRRLNLAVNRTIYLASTVEFVNVALTTTAAMYKG